MLANRGPDLLLRAVAARDVAQAERRVLEERRVEPADEVRLVRTSRADLLRLDGEHGLAADGREVAASTPGARRSAAAMSSIGAVPVVPARTWNPPP